MTVIEKMDDLLADIQHKEYEEYSPKACFFLLSPGSYEIFVRSLSRNVNSDDYQDTSNYRGVEVFTNPLAEFSVELRYTMTYSAYKS